MGLRMMAPLCRPCHRVKNGGISTDTLVGDVHFRLTDPAADIVYRAVATSVSDLYAQCAEPALYLLNLTAPKEQIGPRSPRASKTHRRIWHPPVRRGYHDRACLTLSLTVFGAGKIGDNPLRSQAKVGDQIGLSLAAHGPLGAAKAGFEGDVAFAQAYLRPQPKALNVKDLIHSIINAMADVSDGLLADLGHICAASGGARVWARPCPSPIPINRWSRKSPGAMIMPSSSPRPLCLRGLSISAK